MRPLFQYDAEAMRRVLTKKLLVRLECGLFSLVAYSWAQVIHRFSKAVIAHSIEDLCVKNRRLQPIASSAVSASRCTNYRFLPFKGSARGRGLLIKRRLICSPRASKNDPELPPFRANAVAPAVPEVPYPTLLSIAARLSGECPAPRRSG